MKTPHQWKTIKGLPWPLCKCCGLLALKNDVTAAAIRAGCDP